jgi:M6 family metalloprotease-like protein
MGRQHLQVALRTLYLLVIGFVCRESFAVSASPHPIKVPQPDGTQIRLFLRGDEHFHFYEDERGYTVVRAEDKMPSGVAAIAADGRRVSKAPTRSGWYSYAVLNKDQNQLIPTQLKVGVDKPEGLKPRILPATVHAPDRPQAVSAALDNVPAPPAGDVKNLVVLIRFADHKQRPVPAPAAYTTIFNKKGGDPVLAPTGSVRDVYLENSYGKLRLNSTVLTWVDLPQTEAYYADADSGGTTKMWEAIRAGLDLVDPVVNFKDYDQDHDGLIDAIAFIHSGYGAEWGGPDQDGVDFKDRIWSHKWAISPAWTSQEGIRVGDYHISTGFWDTSGTEPTHIGVVAHETGHFFGLPDLYDYSRLGSGVGAWSMMGDSWGFDGTQQYPPHFCAWSKVKLGWVNPTVITAPGTFQAPAVEHDPTIFKIDSGYSSGEYVLVENRQPIGYDIKIPAGPGALEVWQSGTSMNRSP